MGIKDWTEDERPRERLISKGIDALSDAELLAIVLRTGTKGESAVDLARRLFSHFGGWQGLYSASEKELMQVKGIGTAKAAQIRVGIAISGRWLLEAARERPLLSEPIQVFKLITCLLNDPGREEFFVLMLDQKGRLIDYVSLTLGTLGKIQVHPREVVKTALKYKAADIILAHNHPSGDPHPSEDDKTATNRICMACGMMDIDVLDHVIVGAGNFFSFQQAGLLPTAKS